MIPSLVFLDPWGYKGLSLDLVDGTTKDWGCDTILFFNYNRVNMGLNNPAVVERMTAIFGAERFRVLRQKVTRLASLKREPRSSRFCARCSRVVSATCCLSVSGMNEGRGRAITFSWSLRVLLAIGS